MGDKNEMLRREFFSLASSALIAKQIELKSGENGIPSLIKKIEAVARTDLPGATKIEISYDPEDARVPLMVLVFRV